MMTSWCRHVNWGNCGIPWVNCAVLCVKDDWKGQFWGLRNCLSKLRNLLSFFRQVWRPTIKSLSLTESVWALYMSSASQEIPPILWNPEVHHRIYKSPSPIPILNQLDPIHVPISYFLKIYFNIILPSMPGSPKWFPSLRSPHQHPVCAYPLHHTYYMFRQSHSSWFDQPNNIWWGIRIIKLLVL